MEKTGARSPDPVDTLGVVESRSIAAGAVLVDGMLKAAAVTLLRASAICSGRYLICIYGSREAVSVSVEHARQSGTALSGSFVIANISPRVTTILRRSEAAREGDALAVVECRNASSGFSAADSAVKRSDVRLLRLVAGQGIHGKSYFVLGGDVAAVQEAAEAAEQALGRDCVECVVIPRPDPALAVALTGVARELP